MTMEDLNWVQSRLRNCTNARRQLRICAECLCVDEGTLLESLGYASLDAFRAAHPQNKRSRGPSVERICNPVPPEAMLESILYYYSGAPISSVCRMMGYTQTVTPEAMPGTNIIERYVLDDALTLDDITYNGDGSVASLRVRKRDGSVITWQAG